MATKTVRKPTAPEKQLYREHVEMLRAHNIEPSTQEEFLARYRAAQIRQKGERDAQSTGQAGV